MLKHPLLKCIEIGLSLRLAILKLITNFLVNIVDWGKVIKIVIYSCMLASAFKSIS